MSKYDFKFIDRKKIRLWDHGWFDSTRYDVSGLDVSFLPDDLFVGLLNHRNYKRCYAIPLENEPYTGDEHGPFSIKQLKSSDFVEISFEELTKHIHVRYADEEFYEPPTPAQIESVDAFLNQLPKEGTRWFRLAVAFEIAFLDDDYHHPRPDLFHELSMAFLFFDEYILLNPEQKSMWIIVLGYD